MDEVSMKKIMGVIWIFEKILQVLRTKSHDKYIIRMREVLM